MLKKKEMFEREQCQLSKLLVDEEPNRLASSLHSKVRLFYSNVLMYESMEYDLWKQWINHLYLAYNHL